MDGLVSTATFYGRQPGEPRALVGRITFDGTRFAAEPANKWFLNELLVSGYHPTDDEFYTVADGDAFIQNLPVRFHGSGLWVEVNGMAKAEPDLGDVHIPTTDWEPPRKKKRRITVIAAIERDELEKVWDESKHPRVPPGEHGGGEFAGLGTHLVDYKRDRPLEGPDTKPISHFIPGARHVGYLRVPGIDAMHAHMGLHPTPSTPIPQYEAARNAMFGKLPVEQVPYHKVVFTQGRINVPYLDRLTAAGHEDKPVFMVKHGGSYYLMNGHHRAVANYREGARVLAAHVFEPVRKFNPYHVPSGPEGGEFTTGPGAGAVTFVSPNREENVTFDQAAGRLHGFEQRRLNTVTQLIDRKLGISGKTASGIGAWSDGAEPTVVSYLPTRDYEKVRTAAAMQGLLAEQKAVIPFVQGRGGRDVLHVIDVPNHDLAGLHQQLLKDGVQFHTLQPTPSGTRVLVFNPGGDNGTARAVKQFALGVHGDRSRLRGRGEFLGSWTSRAEGAKTYQQVIDAYRRPVGGGAGGRELGWWDQLHPTFRAGQKILGKSLTWEDVPEHIGLWLAGDLRKDATEPDRQLVTGWASVITEPDGSPVVDLQGDVIEEHDLTDAVHGFMREHRVLGDSHVRLDGVGTVVESLVVTQAVKEALGLPLTTPTGWLVTAHVDDPAVWQRVKSGELGAFSIGGTASREFIKLWKEWREELHPRAPPGSEMGGEFVSTADRVLLAKYETPEVLEARDARITFLKEHGATHKIETPERNRLRAELITRAIQADEQAGVGTERIADVVLGGPGAGKSTVVADPLVKWQRSMLIDPDRFKPDLPGYGAHGEGSGAVHPESSAMAGYQQMYAMKQGYNMVMPMVGKTETKITQLIDNLKNHGYTVRLHYVDVGLEEQVRRTMSRWNGGKGRFTDPAYTILGVDRKPDRTIANVKGSVDEYVRYDNNQPGRPAKVVEHLRHPTFFRPTTARGNGGRGSLRGFLARYAKAGTVH
jgi:predicted ABC-type ATPase